MQLEAYRMTLSLKVGENITFNVKQDDGQANLVLMARIERRSDENAGEYTLYTGMIGEKKAYFLEITQKKPSYSFSAFKAKEIAGEIHKQKKIYTDGYFIINSHIPAGVSLSIPPGLQTFFIDQDMSKIHIRLSSPSARRIRTISPLQPIAQPHYRPQVRVENEASRPEVAASSAIQRHTEITPSSTQQNLLSSLLAANGGTMVGAGVGKSIPATNTHITKIDTASIQLSHQKTTATFPLKKRPHELEQDEAANKRLKEDSTQATPLQKPVISKTAETLASTADKTKKVLITSEKIQEKRTQPAAIKTKKNVLVGKLRAQAKRQVELSTASKKMTILASGASSSANASSTQGGNRTPSFLTSQIKKTTPSVLVKELKPVIKKKSRAEITTDLQAWIRVEEKKEKPIARPHQLEAIKQYHAARQQNANHAANVIFPLPTGTGKTAIMAMLFAATKERTLILVPARSIRQQMPMDIKKFSNNTNVHVIENLSLSNKKKSALRSSLLEAININSLATSYNEIKCKVIKHFKESKLPEAKKALLPGLLKEIEEKIQSRSLSQEQYKSLLQQVKSFFRFETYYDLCANNDVVIATIQLLQRDYKESFPWELFERVILDEAHHTTAVQNKAMTTHVLNHEKKEVLAFTATPTKKLYQLLGYKENGEDNPIKPYSLQKAIQDQVLSPIQMGLLVLNKADDDTEVLSLNGGEDFSAKKVERKFNRAAYNQVIINYYLHSRSPVDGAPICGRPTIISCAGISHIKSLMDELNKIDINIIDPDRKYRDAYAKNLVRHKKYNENAAKKKSEDFKIAVPVYTPVNNNDYKLKDIENFKEQFELGGALIVITCAQLGEGYSFPKLEVAIAFRCGVSETWSTQFFGRILRKHGEKVAHGIQIVTSDIKERFEWFAARHFVQEEKSYFYFDGKENKNNEEFLKMAGKNIPNARLIYEEPKDITIKILKNNKVQLQPLKKISTSKKLGAPRQHLPSPLSGSIKDGLEFLKSLIAQLEQLFKPFSTINITVTEAIEQRNEPVNMEIDSGEPVNVEQKSSPPEEKSQTTSAEELVIATRSTKKSIEKAEAYLNKIASFLNPIRSALAKEGRLDGFPSLQKYKRLLSEQQTTREHIISLCKLANLLSQTIKKIRSVGYTYVDYTPEIADDVSEEKLLESGFSCLAENIMALSQEITAGSDSLGKLIVFYQQSLAERKAIQSNGSDKIKFAETVFSEGEIIYKEICLKDGCEALSALELINQDHYAAAYYKIQCDVKNSDNKKFLANGNKMLLKISNSLLVDSKTILLLRTILDHTPHSALWEKNEDEDVLHFMDKLEETPLYFFNIVISHLIKENFDFSFKHIGSQYLFVTENTHPDLAAKILLLQCLVKGWDYRLAPFDTTVLHYLTYYNCNIRKYLLNQESLDINAINYYGNTPLILLLLNKASSFSSGGISTFFNKKPNILIENRYGKTAIDYILEYLFSASKNLHQCALSIMKAFDADNLSIFSNGVAEKAHEIISFPKNVSWAGSKIITQEDYQYWFERIKLRLSFLAELKSNSFHKKIRESLLSFDVENLCIHRDSYRGKKAYMAGLYKMRRFVILYRVLATLFEYTIPAYVEKMMEKVITFDYPFASAASVEVSAEREEKSQSDADETSDSDSDELSSLSDESSSEELDSDDEEDASETAENEFDIGANNKSVVMISSGSDDALEMQQEESESFENSSEGLDSDEDDEDVSEIQSDDDESLEMQDEIPLAAAAAIPVNHQEHHETMHFPRAAYQPHFFRSVSSPVPAFALSAEEEEKVMQSYLNNMS